MRLRRSRSLRPIPELDAYFTPAARWDHRRGACAGRSSRDHALQASQPLSADLARRADQRRRMWFLNTGQRQRFYAKAYPVLAGLTSLNVDALWESPTKNGTAPEYLRAVP